MDSEIISTFELCETTKWILLFFYFYTSFSRIITAFLLPVLYTDKITYMLFSYPVILGILLDLLLSLPSESPDDGLLAKLHHF